MLKSVLDLYNHFINGAFTNVTVIWIWWWIGRVRLDEGRARGCVHFGVLQCCGISLGRNSVASLSLGLSGGNFGVGVVVEFV